ncbi:MAG: hypothetical protein IJX80_09235 [Clostridia bacterium]|nr:hypothetical protein [Clostridia bacterium]
MLKRMIAAQGAWDARIHREYGEFRDLYPDVALDSLPDALWKEVGNGVPLAAAYALAERKRMYDEARALNDNRKNRERSSGALNASAEDVYSPSEVRAMTPSEVRKNFSKIMQSMQKWH